MMESAGAKPHVQSAMLGQKCYRLVRPGDRLVCHRRFARCNAVEGIQRCHALTRSGSKPVRWCSAAHSRLAVLLASATAALLWPTRSANARAHALAERQRRRALLPPACIGVRMPAFAFHEAHP